jgi:predicted AAA+ superfamily ATPase
MIIKRSRYLTLIETQFRVHPICAILGPRQVGKTTLAREYAERYGIENVHFIDLEDPIDVSRLENPMTTLTALSQTLIIIDEIQRIPELFPILRVLVDREKRKRKYLILGSASRDLIRQSSETLAGRIGYIELPPLTLMEKTESKKLWVRGGFPLSYLAESDADSMIWRQSYITTFLERDIPMLGFNVPAEQMRRFWMMLVHYHGQIFNASELSKSLMVSNHMVRKYLDILAGTFMVRVLLPWFENIQKRQVKMPKIYFRDSGILHTMSGIENYDQLQRFPKLGAYWEGFALEEVIRTLGLATSECFFWGTHGEAELDLLVTKQGKRIGFEFKYVDAPRTTKSIHSALEHLKLDHVVIVYPGNQSFLLSEKVTVCGLALIATGEFQKVLDTILSK